MLIFDLIKALIAFVKLLGRSPNMVVAFAGVFVFIVGLMLLGYFFNQAIYHLYFLEYVLPKLQLLPNDDPYKWYKVIMLRKFNEPMEIVIAYLALEVIYQVIKIPMRFKRRSAEA